MRGDQIMKRKGEKQFAKKAVLLLFVLIFSIGASVFTFRNIFYNVQNNKINITLVNEDTTTNYLSQEVNFGQKVVKMVERDDAYEWGVAMRSEALHKIEKNETDIVVIIPSDFSEKAIAINKLKPEKINLLYVLNPTQNYLQSTQSEAFLEEIRNLFNKNIQEVYFASILQNLDYVKENLSSITEIETTQKDNIVNILQPNISDMNESLTAISEYNEGEAKTLKSIAESLQKYDERHKILDEDLTQYSLDYDSFKNMWTQNYQGLSHNKEMIDRFANSLTNDSQNEQLNIIEQQTKQLIKLQQTNLSTLLEAQEEVTATKEALYKTQRILNDMYTQNEIEETGEIATYFNDLTTQMSALKIDKAEPNDNTTNLERIEQLLETRIDNYCQQNKNYRNDDTEKLKDICISLLDVAEVDKDKYEPIPEEASVSNFNVKKYFLVEAGEKAELQLSIGAAITSSENTLRKADGLQQNSSISANPITIEQDSMTGNTLLKTTYINDTNKAIILEMATHFSIDGIVESVPVQATMKFFATPLNTKAYIKAETGTSTIAGVGLANEQIDLCLFDTLIPLTDPEIDAAFLTSGAIAEVQGRSEIGTIITITYDDATIIAEHEITSDDGSFQVELDNQEDLELIAGEKIAIYAKKGEQVSNIVEYTIDDPDLITVYDAVNVPPLATDYTDCTQATAKSATITMNEHGYFEHTFTAPSGFNDGQNKTITLQENSKIMYQQTKTIYDETGQDYQLTSHKYLLKLEDETKTHENLNPDEILTDEIILTTISDDMKMYTRDTEEVYTVISEILKELLSLYYGYDMDTLHHFVTTAPTTTPTKEQLIEKLRTENNPDSVLAQLRNLSGGLNNSVEQVLNTLAEFKNNIIHNIDEMKKNNNALLVIFDGGTCATSDYTNETNRCQNGLDEKLAEQIGVLQIAQDERYEPLLNNISTFKTTFANLQEEMANIQLSMTDHMDNKSTEATTLQTVEEQHENLFTSSVRLSEQSENYAESAKNMAEGAEKFYELTHGMKENSDTYKTSYEQFTNAFIRSVDENSLFSENLYNFFANSKINGVENNALYNFLSEPVLQKNMSDTYNTKTSLLPYFVIVICFSLSILIAYSLLNWKRKLAIHDYDDYMKEVITSSVKKAIIDVLITLVAGVLIAGISSYFLGFETIQMFKWGVFIIGLTMLFTQINYFLLKAFKGVGLFIILGLFMTYLLTNEIIGISIARSTTFGSLLQLNPIPYFEYAMKYILYDVSNEIVSNISVVMGSAILLTTALNIIVDSFKTNKQLKNTENQVEKQYI